MLGLATVTTLLSAAAKYFSEGRQIKAAVKIRKDELSKLSLETKLQAIKSSDETAIAMDKNTEGRISWADDVSFAVFLLPALLAFWPPALPHIQAGFTALRSMPDWYQYALGMMLVSVWGYRQLVNPIVHMIAKAYLGVRAKN